MYAVAPGRVTVPAGLTGVAGEPPHTVTVPGLAAVVGAVPRADFDEERSGSGWATRPGSNRPCSATTASSRC
ncbi:GvpL/GvpF family gas vesicle protein [Kitasatospora aburaviensis]